MSGRESCRRRDVDADRLHREKRKRLFSPLRDSRYLDVLYHRSHYRAELSLSVRQYERRRRTPSPRIRRHTPSPPRYRRSPLPRIRRRTPSPPHGRRSLTPQRSRWLPSPQRRNRLASPVRSPHRATDDIPRLSQHRNRPHDLPRRHASTSKDGRHRSRNRDSRKKSPTKRPSSPTKRPNRCLGVFGLSCHTSSEDLRRHFGHWGSIKDAQVVSSRVSGLTGGFGYVLYDNVESARKAKKNMTGKPIDGMKLRIEYSNSLPDSDTDSKTMARAWALVNRYRPGEQYRTTIVSLPYAFNLAPASTTTLFNPTTIVQPHEEAVYATTVASSLLPTMHLSNFLPSQYPNMYLP